jgi:hypothetical protein
LLNSQAGSRELIQAEAEAITTGDDKCPQDASILGRNYSKINLLTVVRKGTGRMNVPNRPGTPKRPPRPEAKARLLRESISPPEGEPAPWRKAWSD